MISPNEHNSVVQDQPIFGGASDVVMWLASYADAVPAWGSNMKTRDSKLREFYKTEPYAAGAIYGVASRRASYRWKLHGPKRQVDIVHRILHGSQHGRGFIQLMIMFIKDVLTQDNGGFIEMVHLDRQDEKSPVVQLNHLDSARCMRTGNWETPVIYTDINGGTHELKWYQVIDFCEYPDPDERVRGYQQCAVSRLLLRAQTMRDIGIFEHEKVSGLSADRIHLVGGIQQQRLENVLKVRANQAQQEGYMRYLTSPIIAAMDQTARVSHEEINLKDVPAGYDPEKALRWYTLLLALALGVDPQEIAPLPGGNLGSAQQSEVLRESGRGKGNWLFMQSIEHIMNFHGVLPQTVQFRYEEQDISENEQLTMLKWRRSQVYRSMMGSGTEQPILSVEVIHQMMRDNGDLSDDYLRSMHEPTISPNIERLGDNKSRWKFWSK